MPTFDFHCATCGHAFEYVRPFGSDASPACPECKSKKTEKLFTPPAIQFKGTGFYKTDSAKSGNTAAPKKKEATKTDAKPSDSPSPPAPSS